MVCPYRVTVTLFSAIASIFYLRSTMADDGVGAGSSISTPYQQQQQRKQASSTMSSTRRYVIMTLLALLHIDLLLTGYLRMGVKEGIKMLSTK